MKTNNFDAPYKLARIAVLEAENNYLRELLVKMVALLKSEKGGQVL